MTARYTEVPLMYSSIGCKALLRTVDAPVVPLQSSVAAGSDEEAELKTRFVRMPSPGGTEEAVSKPEVGLRAGKALEKSCFACRFCKLV